MKVLAFDIETVGLGGDAVYCSWCDGGEPQGSIVNKVGYPDFTRLFIDTFLTHKYRGYIIVAHNGLRFDYLRLDWRLIASEGFTGRFYTAKNPNIIRGMNLKRGKHVWKLRDSFTYCQESLKGFAKLFATDNSQKGELDFEKESFDVHNPLHIDYALADAAALYSAVEGFSDMLEERFDVDITDGVTLSGFGFKSMKKLAKENGYGELPYLPAELENAVRSSYHGGFTSAFQIGNFTDLVYYDINSAYAYVMQDYPMPGGQGRLTYTKPRGMNLCFATVNFNDSFPYLISKPFNNKISGRYSGIVCGWFWDFELQLQRKLGADIDEHFWINWQGKDKRLSDFVAKCRELRNLDYHGPIGKLAKLMQNSVYGKCGAADHDIDIVLNLEKPNDDARILIDDVGREIAALWEVDSLKFTKGTMVHWASYITARVRWILMNYLLRVPQEDWIYCDTDSLIVPAKYKQNFVDGLGEDYGQLKLEGELETFELRAPKTYRGKTKEGKPKEAAKGIPRKRTPEAWDTGTATYEGMRSFFYTMRGKLRGESFTSYSRTTKRRLSSPANIACGSFVNNRWQPLRVCAISNPVDIAAVPVPGFLINEVIDNVG